MPSGSSKYNIMKARQFDVSWDHDVAPDSTRSGVVFS